MMSAQMRTGAARLACAAALLVGGTAASARASAIFPIGVALPASMSVIVCPFKDGAERQVVLSERFGALPFDRALFDTFMDNKCVYSYATITPLWKEPGMPSVRTWVATYDRHASTVADVSLQGRMHKIPLSFQLQEHRFYFSSVEMEGEVFKLYVLLPDRPYFMDYLREQEKERR